MEKSEYKINIVGAGLSGLIAAGILENHGYTPHIYESSGEVGGKIKTDLVEGYQLDHGFQVLLNAYPKAKQYLDYDVLDLQKIKPGAVIFSEGKKSTIGDPLRDPSLLIPTIFSGIGNFSDKLKILKLNRNLQKKDFQEIFNSEESTTMEYLRKKKFSEEMISKFFKPFFGGIFLEENLETSCRMFEFVYKMFGEGLAVIPKEGMGSIPKQLASNLNATTFHFNTQVEQVKNDFLILKNGEKIASHATIIATEASSLISNLKEQEFSWRSCHNFYFEVKKRSIDPALIGLITDKEAIINNIFFHNSVETASKGKKQLLSVTVIKETALQGNDLQRKVEQDLKKYCGVGETRFLKHYYIRKALPKIKHLHYELDPTESQLTERIFLAGDQHLNASQNAAILSGESAAYGLMRNLQF